MKPLVTNYRILTWLWVCPSEEKISWCCQFAHISLVSSIFFANVLLIICSLLYFYETVSVDLSKSLYAFGQIIGFISVTYMVIVALILRGKITELFRSLSRIYERSKNFHSFLKFLIKILFSPDFGAEMQHLLLINC